MKAIREASVMLLVLTILTGVAYPLLVTGVAQLLFPERAGGSLIRDGATVVGSRLIGQPFESPGYFWSRPSATATHPYNAGLSGGSNLGPLHPDLIPAVQQRIEALRRATGADRTSPVPIDLVTTSGSGLDPHISPAAAFYQIGRVAAARGVAPDDIRAILERHVEPRQLGILGEPRVNVLALNRALEDRFGPPPPIGEGAAR